jgi:bifunctional ADP-heptose synthase (sugar kinase/adenylyltransferase)
MIGCGIGEDLESMGREILAALRLEALLITRGNKGMTLFLRDGAVHHIPATRQDEVTDVTGAGDTVSAVCTLCLASGADFLTAAKISNVAAGIVVMKRGTATVSREELLREIERWGG